jgi:thioesterase domain-containing protein
MVLLHSNEQKLLSMKFDEILAFLNSRVLENFLVCVYLVDSLDDPSYTLEKVQNTLDKEPGSENEKEHSAEDNAKYDVDAFVQSAIALKITPFMLDAFAHEYEDMVRARDAHAIEMDELRNSNRALSAQMCV